MTFPDDAVPRSAPVVLMPSSPSGSVHDRGIAWRHAEAALDARGPTSMFRSAAWMRASVETWDARTRWRLIEVTGRDRVPAWALLGASTHWRRRLLPVRVLALNQSGIDALDQPWIEHNGFFGGDPASFAEHLGLLLARLDGEPGWDELRLGGLAETDAQPALRLAAARGLVARLAIEQPTYEVDLDAVRARHGGDYLAALSANTRQQLRRSRRDAERLHGPIRVERAATAAEAHACLDATAPLHRARWRGAPIDGAGGAPASGFDNPSFVAFHRRLIEHAFDVGGIDYLRVSAGDRLLAYLYNFVAGDRVQFYLSGVDHALDASLRPGLLSHWAAIERALTDGRRVYDFLAGDARYKRSLSGGGGRATWLVLQRPRWRLQLEDAARRLKRAALGSAR